MAVRVAHAEVDAVLFDLDGVLTTTRTVHAAAWKDTFDDLLERWDAEHGTSTARFDLGQDYPALVDGRPRQEGAARFLDSRGIRLPDGRPDSPADEVSVWGVANRKQDMVEAELERVGVEPFPGSVAWVRELREAGVRTAVVSASRNCARVLDYAGIGTLFDTVVDGGLALELGLRGKPAPDTFLEAARVLGVDPARAAVVEDALPGVEAGRSGGFAVVVAVDRDGHAQALREHGADVVVLDLSEMLAPSTEPMHRAGPREHRLIAAAARILATTTDYSPDPWRLVERSYNPEYVGQTETLFAVANGYLGIRASFEEGVPSFHPGTLLNGFHETWPIVYPERAHGFATTGQTIVPVPDGTSVRLFVDDDPVTCENTEVLEFERALDMQRAALDRSVVYQFPDGRRFWVRTKRFVSLVHRHLACLRYQITALDEPGRLTVVSELVTPADEHAGADDDPRRSRSVGERVLSPEGERLEGTRAVRGYRTRRSGLAVAAGMDHDVDGQDVTHRETTADDERVRVVFDVTAPVGRTATIVKWLAYHHGPEPTSDLLARATTTLDRARDHGYRQVFSEHVDATSDFWARTDVLWEGAPAAQSAIRYSLFSVWQAAARSEGFGVAAKGLTGTGYEGHYFWDTEVYVLPMLVHTSPQVARALLMHRIRMLDDARRRAREVGCAGALFPWRTINGEEASAYYAAGTAQYHINADIAYALDQYVSMTGDTDLLVRHGAELLVETARMWAGLGHFSARHDGRFVIQKVTGPDEYTTVVDNNLFTNLMAAENMRMAADVVQRLRTQSPGEYRRLVERTGLAGTEEADWRDAAERIYVPYDQQAQVHLQDEGFLDLKPWDFATTPTQHYPLLLHFHPLVIYRHQVIKQADVVLATVLLPERFARADLERIFAYYDPLTTGDSSLSESIQAIAAAAIGKYRSAEEYLVDAMAVDMADTAGNVRDGVHVASAGGTWMAVVFGFAGFRWRSGGLQFAPILPTRARRVRFPLRLGASVLEVDITRDLVTYTLREGPEITASHHGEPFTVAVGTPVSFTGAFRTSDLTPAPGTAPGRTAWRDSGAPE
jgi:alpha,alpha-trehalose phosphorylase